MKLKWPSKPVALFITAVIAFTFSFVVSATKQPETQSIVQQVSNVHTHAHEPLPFTDNNEEPRCPSLIQTENGGINATLVSQANSALSNGSRAIYRMWFIEYPDGTFFTPVELIYGAGDGICGLAYTRGIESITTLIPLDIARSLTLDFYTKVADSQGFDVFKRNLLSVPSSDDEGEEYDYAAIGTEIAPAKPTFTSVQIWTFEQMGIELPEDLYELDDIDNDYEYGD